MKTLLIIASMLVAVALAPARQSNAGEYSPALPSEPFVVLTLGDAEPPAEPGDGDSKDDPGYKMYKDGYNLVLDEQWKDARKKFAEMIKLYPKSNYVDDAEYWSAYAMKHISRKDAIAEYKKFIKENPTSNYYDDAQADLSELEAYSLNVLSTAPGASVESSGAPEARAFSYSYSAPEVERTTRDLEHKIRIMSMPHMPSMGPMTLYTLHGRLSDKDESVDPETQLKIEALYALGNGNQDDKAFQRLKEVAVDRSQNVRLREAAIDALSNFKDHDLLPIYLEIAKHDTVQAMQDLSLEYLSTDTKDKNKSVGALIDLFNTIPSDRHDQRRTIFYFIADVGNDRAVDFLAGVARGGSEYDLRREAIYYLGNIGSDKARAALYQVLEGK